MRGYEKYIRDIQSGKVIACKYIKQVVDRFCEFRERPDIYFDAKAVDGFMDFIGQMKHWAGKSAGKNFFVADLFHSRLNNDYFYMNTFDGLHPDEDGMRLIAEVIEESITHHCINNL